MILATLQKVHIPSRVLIMSALSLCFAVIIGLSALIKIPVPFTPIPITLQTFALLAGAGILNKWYSLQMVFWYIVLGVLGAPFFTNGSGIQALIGPTAGYLFGFILASMILGFSKKSNSLTFILATMTIYLPGVLWLKIATSENFMNIIKMGVVPFILFDAIKAIAAYSSVRSLKYFTNK